MKKSKRVKKSNTWKIKQHRDQFFKKSKTLGYRSRAAFKLIELNNKFKFIKKNTNLLDLGSSPGGWSQVASQLITNGRIQSKKITAFQFYGPTCDSLDYMKGPFLLPNNIKEGDYIELGQLGAYGLTFRTKFNGFYSDTIVELKDKPIMSLYNDTGKFNYLVA